jgi:hypothetical protein
MYDNDYMNAKIYCEMCPAHGDDWHHGIYKRNKKIPQLNSKENMIYLCKEHHRLLESMGYEGRCFVWKVKCIEFGEEHMRQWHEELPMKVKEHFG